MFSTVIENKEFYTHADIEGSERARIYQGLLGWTATSAFNTYVKNNLLLSCNKTLYDINRYTHINGKATPVLQGKMRRKKPTVHLKLRKYLQLFQYQRDTKTYTYT